MTRVISTLVVVLLLASWPGLCPAAEQLLELSYDGPAMVSIDLDVYYPVAWAEVRHTGPAQLHFESRIDYAQISTHRYYFPEYRFGIATLDTVINCRLATCPTGPLVIYSCPLGCGCALTGAWTDAYDGDYSRTYNYKYSVTARDSNGVAGSICRNAVMRVSSFEEVDGRVSLAFSFYDSESIRGRVSVSWNMPVPVEGTTWGRIKSRYR